MKNKKTVLALLIFSLASFLFSAELTSFSFEPEFGFLNGKIVENVWYVDVIKSDTTITYTPSSNMSRLDWQLENVPYFGADIKTVFNQNLLIDFHFINAINGSCGIMEDYDWLNPITPEWKDDPPDELTNYSIHTLNLDSLTNIDFKIGKIFYLDTEKNISLTPSFGINIETLSFIGINGWKTYKELQRVIPCHTVACGLICYGLVDRWANCLG